MRSITNQVPKHTDERGDDHPGAIDRQEHEAEIVAAEQRFGHLIGLAGRAVMIAGQALDDQREAEGQQQPVKMVEPVEPLQHRPLDNDADQFRRGPARQQAPANNRDRVYCNSRKAAKAPIMYWAPWAKLMMLSMPKITASPRLSSA